MANEKQPLSLKALGQHEQALEQGIAHVRQVSETIGTPAFSRRPDLDYTSLDGIVRVAQAIRIGEVKDSLKTKTLPALQEQLNNVRQIEISSMEDAIAKLREYVAQGILPEEELVLATQTLVTLQAKVAGLPREEQVDYSAGIAKIAAAETTLLQAPPRGKEVFTLPNGQNTYLSGPMKIRTLKTFLENIEQSQVGYAWYEQLSQALYNEPATKENRKKVYSMVYSLAQELHESGYTIGPLYDDDEQMIGFSLLPIDTEQVIDQTARGTVIKPPTTPAIPGSEALSSPIREGRVATPESVPLPDNQTAAISGGKPIAIYHTIFEQYQEGNIALIDYLQSKHYGASSPKAVRALQQSIRRIQQDLSGRTDWQVVPVKKGIHLVSRVLGYTLSKEGAIVMAPTQTREKPQRRRRGPVGKQQERARRKNGSFIHTPANEAQLSALDAILDETSIALPDMLGLLASGSKKVVPGETYSWAQAVSSLHLAVTRIGHRLEAHLANPREQMIGTKVKTKYGMLSRGELQQVLKGAISAWRTAQPEDVADTIVVAVADKMPRPEPPKEIPRFWSSEMGILAGLILEQSEKTFSVPGRGTFTFVPDPDALSAAQATLRDLPQHIPQLADGLMITNYKITRDMAVSKLQILSKLTTRQLAKEITSHYDGDAQRMLAGLALTPRDVLQALTQHLANRAFDNQSIEKEREVIVNLIEQYSGTLQPNGGIPQAEVSDAAEDGVPDVSNEPTTEPPASTIVSVQNVATEPVTVWEAQPPQEPREPKILSIEKRDPLVRQTVNGYLDECLRVGFSEPMRYTQIQHRFDEYGGGIRITAKELDRAKERRLIDDNTKGLDGVHPVYSQADWVVLMYDRRMGRKVSFSSNLAKELRQLVDEELRKRAELAVDPNDREPNELANITTGK